MYTINKYLDQVDSNKFGKNNEEIFKGIDFDYTAVDLYIPKDGLTKQQFDVISNLKLKEDISLNIFVLS